MVDRYKSKQPKGSEYGGKSGLIQTAEDGHTDLTAQEKATIMRHHGIQGDLSGSDADFEVNAGVDVDEDQTKWEDIAHRNKAMRRKNIDERLNGRQIGEAL